MNHPESADAMTLLEAGRLTEAAALYRTILLRDPDHPDSLHLLGLILTEQSDPEAGIVLIRRAMALDPDRAVHLHSLGQAYRRLGRMEDAVCALRAAAGLRPDAVEIQSNLGTVLRELGRHAEAVEHYRRAVALAPDSPDMWYNLANALAGTGPAAETGACYRRAIGLRPDFGYAHANYGRWSMTLGRWQEAYSALTQAVRLLPDDAAVRINLGAVLQELGSDRAEDCYREAIGLDPRAAGAHYNLGRWLSGQGRPEDAVASHRAAVAIDPGFGAARLAACMSELPVLYRTEDEIAGRRRRYAVALEELAASPAPSLADAIGSAQPFFLPYQNEDDRDLQAMYGRFACDVLAASGPPAVLAARPAAGERIRLGIVSGFFCDHTLFKLFLEGWLTRLDRSRFVVTGFHTAPASDANTARCAALCDRFVQGLAPAAWRDAIAATAPHVLLYPEVGIDPIAGRLAAMRLAPVQCAAWGQPDTTGMPTIDYFLSSALMEPPEGDAYYTERLVRLPHLGMCYTPDAPPRGAMAGPGIRDPANPDAPVFWSGQALYKYLPQHDAVFPRIAAALGECRFVFVAFAKSRAVTDAFHNRLRAAFAAAGLNADRHVVILPPLSQDEYIRAVGQADVVLDTVGWSGGKSTLDSLAVDPAIVTLPGRFMRGRHTAAILRHIGCEATIAADQDDYVSIAVRLARDRDWCADIRRGVASGKHRAFGDLAYIRALETFLADAVAGGLGAA